MADNKGSARRATAKAAKGGSSPIAGMGAKVKAAAAKARANVTMTRNGPKASETAHLHPQQFGAQTHNGINAGYIGKHGSTSMTSAKKNSYGTSYVGKRRSGTAKEPGVYV